jgi:DNA-binding NarL/FixJ family response regulator
MRDIDERHARSRRAVLYLDEQHLTRDCVSRELSRHLPELQFDSRTSAQDLAPNDQAFALVILHIHGALIDNEASSSRSDDSRVGAELTKLQQAVPDAPLVLLSDTESTQNILGAFRRRIRGYIPTTLPIGLVAEAIRLISKGGTYIPPAILSLSRSLVTARSAESVARHNEIASFSPRQSEVLHRLWLGKSNKSIAYELNMCESTVKVHIRSIMKKLKVNNRTQVVVMTRPLGHGLEFEQDVRRPTSTTVELLRAPTVQPLLPKAEISHRIRVGHGLPTIQARRGA